MRIGKRIKLYSVLRRETDKFVFSRRFIVEPSKLYLMFVRGFLLFYFFYTKFISRKTQRTQNSH